MKSQELIIDGLKQLKTECDIFDLDFQEELARIILEYAKKHR